MSLNSRQEAIHAEKLVMVSHSIKLASDIFAELMEKGYRPENMENIYAFMFGMRTSADALTNLITNQKAIIEAHKDLKEL
jgi:hypothetical protein